MSISRFLPLTLLLGTLACSNDDDPHVKDVDPVCTEINEVCHDADDGSDDVATECHHAAHLNDSATCQARRRECLDFCAAKLQAGHGGAGGHGGAHGHAGEHAH